MKIQKEIKVGDIIARTTIPDRIVIMVEKELHTVKINNGRIFPLKIDEFDVVVGNIYNTPPPGMDGKSFEDVVKPLMKYLAENHHPHVSAHITSNVAELVEGLETVVTDEFIVD